MKKVLCLLALSALLVVPAAVHADAQLDFGIGAPTPGTISYAGGLSPLVGTNIQVDNVTGINGTPLNNNVTTAITGGLLNFTSGANTGGYNWGPGGSITVAGSVFGNPSTTLMSATITSASVTVVAGTFKVAVVAAFDPIDSSLTTFYGLPADPPRPYTVDLNLSFNASGSAPSAFSSTSVLSGDLVATPTPEPSSIALLGFGVAGLVSYAWRRRKVAA
jgi:hypothetical protein